MRSGGCTVHQALTSESENTVKQAVALAKRRGHAQVTPVHVATTMLSSSNGILRTACLQSHSHPLQCKALELCFNVALNRLPAFSSTSPIMLAIPSSPNPTISNALVAAFKRAQAYQRRGSIDNPQQQPIIALKIEIEQLIISILDDPSVSRVMKEAGFSSTQVKSNIEQVLELSLDLSSSSQNPTSSYAKETVFLHTNNHISKTLISPNPAKAEDIQSVLKGLLKKKGSIVLVGECIYTLENVIIGVRDEFEKLEDITEELKGVKFISVSISSFNHLNNHEVNEKIEELVHIVKDVYVKGVVLYIGDIKEWMIDYEDTTRYSPVVEHVISELGKLACGVSENVKCWLLGIGTFATYTRSRNNHHLLRWALHPVTLSPAGSLGLSLGIERVTREEYNLSCQHVLDSMSENRILCSDDCSEKIEDENRSMNIEVFNNKRSNVLSMPSWLKDANIHLEHNHQNILPIGDLWTKWNSISSKETNSSENAYTFSLPAASPSSSGSVFSQNSVSPQYACETLRFPFKMQDPAKNPIFSVPISNSDPSSRSSSRDIMEIDYYYIPRFKEYNSENLKFLCNVLEQKVPWQKDNIQEIVATVLQCRSGMLKRKSKQTNQETKEETWLFFHGLDTKAKELIAKELAKVVFGSYSSYVSITITSFSSIGRIAEAISENPHRVIMVEHLEEADMCTQMGIKRAIERGKISCNSHSIGEEEVSLSDAIILLSCESSCSRSSGGVNPFVNLDLNLSFDDEDVEQSQSVDDMGIIESVDGLIIFRQQEFQEAGLDVIGNEIKTV